MEEIKTFRVDVNINKDEYNNAMDYIKEHEGEICHDQDFGNYHHLIVRFQDEDIAWGLMLKFK